MKIKSTLIGLIMIVVGGVISATATIYIGAPLVFLGAFLFAGLYSDDIFVDYVTFENDNYIYSIRKRYYYHFFPFDFIMSCFGCNIKFVYKVNYYKIISKTLELKDVNSENINNFQISKPEYKQLLDNQKQQYLNQVTPQEIVADLCSPNIINVKSIKTRYIISLILTLLSLTMFTQPMPAAWALATLYGGLLGWLTILRYGDYKQAKFKCVIYNNYFNNIIK